MGGKKKTNEKYLKKKKRKQPGQFASKNQNPVKEFIDLVSTGPIQEKNFGEMNIYNHSNVETLGFQDSNFQMKSRGYNFKSEENDLSANVHTHNTNFNNFSQKMEKSNSNKKEWNSFTLQKQIEFLKQKKALANKILIKKNKLVKITKICIRVENRVKDIQEQNK